MAETPQWYYVKVSCSNCRYTGRAQLRYGVTVAASPCPECSCVTLTFEGRAPFPDPPPEQSQLPRPNTQNAPRGRAAAPPSLLDAIRLAGQPNVLPPVTDGPQADRPTMPLLVPGRSPDLWSELFAVRQIRDHLVSHGVGESMQILSAWPSAPAGDTVVVSLTEFDRRWLAHWLDASGAAGALQQRAGPDAWRLQIAAATFLRGQFNALLARPLTRFPEPTPPDYQEDILRLAQFSPLWFLSEDELWYPSDGLHTLFSRTLPDWWSAWQLLVQVVPAVTMPAYPAVDPFGEPSCSSTLPEYVWSLLYSSARPSDVERTPTFIPNAMVEQARHSTALVRDTLPEAALARLELRLPDGPPALYALLYAITDGRAPLPLALAGRYRLGVVAAAEPSAAEAG